VEVEGVGYKELYIETQEATKNFGVKG